MSLIPKEFDLVSVAMVATGTVSVAMVAIGTVIAAIAVTSAILPTAKPTASALTLEIKEERLAQAEYIREHSCELIEQQNFRVITDDKGKAVTREPAKHIYDCNDVITVFNQN